MRLKEILCERISLSSNTNNVQSELADLVKNIDVRLRKQFKLPEQRAELIDKLITHLSSSLGRYLEQQSEELTGHKINVEFVVLEKGSGRYVYGDNTMYITQELVSNIADRAVVAIYRGIIAGQPPDVISADVRTTIGQLTKIFIHELTHSVQLHTAKSDDYAHSYIERDKLKFYTAILDPKTQHDIDIYLGQPEEISAHAQELVSDLGTKLYEKPKREQLKIINQFFKDIQTNSIKHPYTHMASSKDPTMRLVFRRFLKQLYQELAEYKKTIK